MKAVGSVNPTREHKERLTKGSRDKSQNSDLGKVGEDKQSDDDGYRDTGTLDQSREDRLKQARICSSAFQSPHVSKAALTSDQVNDSHDGISPSPAKSSLLSNVAGCPQLTFGRVGDLVLLRDHVAGAFSSR